MLAESDARQFLQHLIDSRRTHAAADTHGNDSAFCLPPFQLVEELGGQFGARASQGMTEGNGAAVGVDIPGLSRSSIPIARIE